MIKRISYIGLWIIIGLFLLPGGLASWQKNLTVEGYIITTSWTGGYSDTSDFSLEPDDLDDSSLLQEPLEEPDGSITDESVEIDDVEKPQNGKETQEPVGAGDEPDGAGKSEDPQPVDEGEGENAGGGSL